MGMDFDEDDAKEAEVRAERGHGFGVPVRIFAGRTVEWPDDNHGDDDAFQMIAVGRAEGRIWTAVYEDRADGNGSYRWIITAWPSERWARERWHAGA